MNSLRRKLMATTALPVALGLGIALAAGAGTAACGPCDPCAPAAAAACAPCAAAGAGTECYVPRLQEAAADPCTACDPCAPLAAACDPCAPMAAACDPCAPMAAAAPHAGAPAELDAEAVRRIQEALNQAGHDAGPVDGIWGPMTEDALISFQLDQDIEPTGTLDARSVEALGLAAVPMAAAACAVCDPCAPMAAACDPCAPMAAACDPCAPMAAACGPCDPCAPAMACGPCDPCAPCAAAAPPPDLSDDELTELYECLLEHMRSAYGDLPDAPGFAALDIAQLWAASYGESGLEEAADFVDWPNVARVPYVSSTHGDRFVTNHVNREGEAAYREYEDIDAMPVGGLVAKPSFTISPEGEALLGPLFLMEKMEEGWNPESADWRYTSVMPDGTIAARTLGENAEAAVMCADCHMAMGPDQDSLLFLPEKYRAD